MCRSLLQNGDENEQEFSKYAATESGMQELSRARGIISDQCRAVVHLRLALEAHHRRRRRAVSALRAAWPLATGLQRTLEVE